MANRRSRLVLAVTGVAALALWIGTVAAKTPVTKDSVPFKPGKAISIEGIDPVFTKQLTPRPLNKDEINNLQKLSAVPTYVPKFQVKHLEAKQIAQLVGASDPTALPAPVVFDARTTYHDDATYMEIEGYNGGQVGVRPLRNYLHFTGPDDVMASPFLRPSVLIHFRARANTRYLMECAVDASGDTTFHAADTRGEYTVSSVDKTTLLYMRDQAGAGEDVTVQISGDKPGWYFDGCELTASAR
jgi:hypothetical protein